MTRDEELIERFAAKGVALCLDEGGRPRFVSDAGPGDRVLICSLPKSGTYLIVEMFKQLGSVFSGIHAAEWGFTDVRGDPDAVRTDPLSFTTQFAIEDVAPLIVPGQFLVGHLPRSTRVLNSFSGFRIVFLHRNVRDAFASFMRYMARNNYGSSVSNGWGALPDGPVKMVRFARLHASEFFTMATPMAPWAADPNVLRISYEELMGDIGKECQTERIQALAAWANIPLGAAPDIAGHAASSETLTRSQTRTAPSLLWNCEVERIFIESGGAHLNEVLGYPEPPDLPG